jgi:hypothetical protein
LSGFLVLLSHTMVTSTYSEAPLCLIVYTPIVTRNGVYRNALTFPCGDSQSGLRSRRGEVECCYVWNVEFKLTAEYRAPAGHEDKPMCAHTQVRRIHRKPHFVYRYHAIPRHNILPVHINTERLESVFCIAFGKCPSRISAGTKTTLNEVFHRFPHSTQKKPRYIIN